MLYEMAESLINSIVGGPDYEHADVQEKIVLQRGNEFHFLVSSFIFKYQISLLKSAHFRSNSNSLDSR